MVAPFGIMILHLQQFEENLALICLGSFKYRVIIVLLMPLRLVLGIIQKKAIDNQSVAFSAFFN